MFSKAKSSVIKASDDWTEEDAEAALKAAWDDGAMPDALVASEALAKRISKEWRGAASKHPTGELSWVGRFGILKVLIHALA